MNARGITRRAAILACGALLLTGCDDASPTGPEPSAALIPAAPLLMDYVKVETAPGSLNWLGSVSGDIDGGLETRVVGATQSGHVLHIVTEWRVDAGLQSFEARLEGTLDTRSGGLLLNGEITSGYLEGARAFNQGQLTGIDAVTGGTVFEGSLRILPGSGS